MRRAAFDVRRVPRSIGGISVRVETEVQRVLEEVRRAMRARPGWEGAALEAVTLGLADLVGGEGSVAEAARRAVVEAAQLLRRPVADVAEDMENLATAILVSTVSGVAMRTVEAFERSIFLDGRDNRSCTEGPDSHGPCRSVRVAVAAARLMRREVSSIFAVHDALCAVRAALAAERRRPERQPQPKLRLVGKGTEAGSKRQRRGGSR